MALQEFLPVRKVANIVSLGEIMTPLVPLRRSVRSLGAERIIVKDEGRLPTGSFKARGLALAVRHGQRVWYQAHGHSNQWQRRSSARCLL